MLTTTSSSLAGRLLLVVVAVVVVFYYGNDDTTAIVTFVVNAQQQVICNICLTGSAVTEPFAPLIPSYSQNVPSVLCGEAQLAGQSGMLTQEECLQAQFYASNPSLGNPCGCTPINGGGGGTPTPSPVPPPVPSPVSSPTNSPTPAPVLQPYCNICQLAGGGKAQCNGVIGNDQCINVENMGANGQLDPLSCTLFQIQAASTEVDPCCCSFRPSPQPTLSPTLFPTQPPPTPDPTPSPTEGTFTRFFFFFLHVLPFLLTD